MSLIVFIVVMRRPVDEQVIRKRSGEILSVNLP